MKNAEHPSHQPAAHGPLFFHPEVPEFLRNQIVRLSRILYDETWHPGTRTSCIFTSIVLATCLNRLGFDARPMPVAVEGRLPGARFGIGHPDYPLTRPTAWKGHMVCMVGSVLVDPTIGQIGIHAVWAPTLIALPCARPWSPEASATLPSGCVLSWTARGASRDWIEKADAEPRVWRPASERLMARLHGERDQPPVRTAG